MITNTFKKIAGLMLNANNNYYGCIPVKTTNGTTYYLTGNYSSGAYPNSVTTSLSANGLNAGIALGTGTTTPTADDYRIESPITSGISIQSNSAQKGVDASGNPTLDYILTIKNTGGASVTISEIAYNQSVHAASSVGGSSGSFYPVCIDHTLLDTPVTIAAGDYGVIRYELKCIFSSS